MIEDDPKRNPPPPEENEAIDERTAELVSYLDGELEPGKANEVEAKLGRDTHLRREAESLRRAWDLLDFLPRPEPSADFTNKTLSQVLPLKELSPGGSAVSSPRNGSSPSGSPLAAISNRSEKASTPGMDSSLYHRLLWGVAILFFAWVGWLSQPPIRNLLFPREEKNYDVQLVTEMRLLEHLKYYRHIEDLSFLQALDTQELFGEEPFIRE